MNRNLLKQIRSTITALLATTLVAACATPERIAEQAVDANRALDRAASQVVLLNVIRAAFDLPLHFSRVSQISGPMNNVYLTPTLTRVFNPQNVADPTTLSSGALGLDRPTFAVQSMDDQDSIRGINRQIDFQTVANLLEMSGRDPLTLRITIDRVVFTLSMNENRPTKVIELRNDPSDVEMHETFVAWAEAAAKCGYSLEPRTVAHGPKATITLQDGLVATAQVMQQLAAISTSSYRLVSEEENGKKKYQLERLVPTEYNVRPRCSVDDFKELMKKASARNHKLGTIWDSFSKGDCTKPNASDSAIMRVLSFRTGSDGVTAETAAETSRSCIDIVPRSTDASFRYVGKLLKPQLAASDASNATAKYVGLIASTAVSCQAREAFLRPEEVSVSYQDRTVKICPEDTPSRRTLTVLKTLLSLQSKANEAPSFLTIRQN